MQKWTVHFACLLCERFWDLQDVLTLIYIGDNREKLWFKKIYISWKIHPYNWSWNFTTYNTQEQHSLLLLFPVLPFHFHHRYLYCLHLSHVVMLFDVMLCYVIGDSLPCHKGGMRKACGRTGPVKLMPQWSLCFIWDQCSNEHRQSNSRSKLEECAFWINERLLMLEGKGLE